MVRNDARADGAMNDFDLHDDMTTSRHYHLSKNQHRDNVSATMTHSPPIVFVPGSLHTSPRAASGRFWCVIGEQPFPMEGWSDAVVVVLGWWANALIRLNAQAGDMEVVHFMEGPYEVEIRRLADGTFRVSAVERRKLDVRRPGASDMSFATLSNALIAAATTVLEECRGASWWSRDAASLQTAIEQLSTVTAQHEN